MDVQDLYVSIPQDVFRCVVLQCIKNNEVVAFQNEYELRGGEVGDS